MVEVGNQGGVKRELIICTTKKVTITTYPLRQSISREIKQVAHKEVMLIKGPHTSEFLLSQQSACGVAANKCLFPAGIAQTFRQAVVTILVIGKFL